MVFITETMILWKSHGPVSITQEFLKLQGLFVNIRSIQEGYAGFLKQVGSLIRLLNLYDSQKDSRCGSSILTLKSPNKIVVS